MYLPTKSRSSIGNKCLCSAAGSLEASLSLRDSISALKIYFFMKYNKSYKAIVKMKEQLADGPFDTSDKYIHIVKYFYNPNIFLKRHLEVLFCFSKD